MLKSVFDFRTFDLSVLFLIASNLVPLFGVVFLGWSVGALLAVYWLETVIVAILNYPKILMAGAGGFSAKLFTCAFFTVHFGMFSFVHREFLILLFNAGPEFSSLFERGWMFWAALSLLASHGFSTAVNFFGKKEYLHKTPNSQMFAPYPRVMVLHIVIILGGGLVMAFGQIWALVLLIVLKVIADIGLHNASHATRNETP